MASRAADTIDVGTAANHLNGRIMSAQQPTDAAAAVGDEVWLFRMDVSVGSGSLVPELHAYPT